jgi:dinuclear metal center YbgI/SA1388 family protein
MPSLDAIVRVLGEIAPLSLAEDWDRVGLLVAGDGREIRRAVLAIDVTPAVLAEACSVGAELVVGYHPLLFRPLERLDGATWQCRVAMDAVRAGIAIYSPHTALDAVVGGINDWLVETVDPAARDVRALAPAAATGDHTHKLVVFVPESALEEVRTALAEANAGQIGAYSHCSFTVRGEGTFFGAEGSNPAVGKPGHLERVGEVRLEMVFHRRDLGRVVAALRGAHPYEEPAFDLVPLAPVPGDHRLGAGRVATLSVATTAAEIAEAVRPALGGGVIARTRGGTRRHERFAVCAGSGASLLEKAAAAGATLLLTGELSHHDVLRAHELGLEVLLAGHTNTERGYLPRLAERMAQALAADTRAPGLEIRIAAADVDPLA